MSYQKILFQTTQSIDIADVVSDRIAKKERGMVVDVKQDTSYTLIK